MVQSQNYSFRFLKILGNFLANSIAFLSPIFIPPQEETTFLLISKGLRVKFL